MKPTQVKEIVQDFPYMTLEKGQYIYDFIIKNNLPNMLELGFAHGVSSLYFAGAAQDLNGKLTTVDLIRAKNLNPNIETLLKTSNLESYVECYYEPKSYTWRLLKMLQEGKKDIYDFVYIDGAHDWDTTGYAFFLVSKLLKKNGWVLFDDLYYTIEKSSNPNKDKYPPDIRVAPQIKYVYDLLVKTDDRYGNFFSPPTIKNWGFAQKIA